MSMTGTPQKNRAAVLHGIRDVRLEDRAVPEPGPREVLVEVRSVGVCGSDIHYYEQGRIGDMVVRAPMVLGHEASGVVVGLGAGATRHEIGQRVALEPGVPCLHCRECRTGHYNLCRDVRFFATPPIDGAFATYVTTHEDFAFAVPDGLSDAAAALVEPLSVGIWASRRGGLLAAASARAAGASNVIVTDVNPHRLAQAVKFGATATHDSREGTLDDAGIEADVLLECSGHPDAVRGGIATLRPAGRAVLIGMGADELPLRLDLLQRRELTITGTFRYANTYPAAIALAASGQINMDALVTGRFELDEVEAALTASEKDPTTVKSVVVVSEGA
jgi:L-iditol 2-dehydrogenase